MERGKGVITLADTISLRLAHSFICTAAFFCSNTREFISRSVLRISERMEPFHLRTSSLGSSFLNGFQELLNMGLRAVRSQGEESENSYLNWK